jgi:hypothetical protein
MNELDKKFLNDFSNVCIYNDDLMSYLRKCMSEKTVFKSTKTDRYWYIAHVSVPKNGSFGNLNVHLYDVNKKPKFFNSDWFKVVDITVFYSLLNNGIFVRDDTIKLPSFEL